MRICFEIPGRPVPQERPFVTRYGTFDRKKSKRAKELVRMLAIAARQREKLEVSEVPFTVWMNF